MPISSPRYQSLSRNGFQHLPVPRLLVNSDPDGGRSLMRSPSRLVYNDASLSRSFNDLRTMSRNDVRPATSTDVAEVNPEIMSIGKNNALYHVSVDLNANFMNPLKRSASALPHETLLKDQEYIYRQSFRDDIYDTIATQYGHINPAGNHRSVHDLTTYQPTSNLQSPSSIQGPILTFPQQRTYPNLNSKATANIDVAKNGPTRSTEASYAGLQGDDFVIKSIKPTMSAASATNQADESVTLDLRLFGRAVAPESAPEYETLQTKPSRKKSPAQRKSKRFLKTELQIQDEVDVASPRSASRSRYRALDFELRPQKLQTTNVGTEVHKKQTTPKSCNTDPEVVNAGVQTVSVRNTAAQTDEYEDSVPEENIRQSEETVRKIQPQSRSDRFPRQTEEPVNHGDETTSTGFIRRLMEGAPQGSLQQKMDVRKEDDQIVGPLPKEEIERMYTNSMINVDSVSEKVDLALSNGIAHLLVKIIYERIVPIRETADTFKKSSVVVTKIIDVDLTVTEERKKIYEHITENHKSGKLDNKYTFELYKAFIALAEADDGYGTNQEHLSIQKQVDEEKLWSLNSMSGGVGEESLSFKILENKFSDINKEPVNSYRPSTSSEMMNFNRIDVAGLRQGNMEQNSNEAGDMTKEFYAKTAGNSFERIFEDNVDNNEYNTKFEIKNEWNDIGRRQGTSALDAAYETNRNEEVRIHDLFKKNTPDDWKSIYDNWTSEAVNENASLAHGRMFSRINVHDYLRAGGNRTYNMATNLASDAFGRKSLIDINGISDNNFKISVNSLSDKILDNADIEHGGHRRRMESYEKTDSNNVPIVNKNALYT